jgi:hypothetical protein
VVAAEVKPPLFAVNLDKKCMPVVSLFGFFRSVPRPLIFIPAKLIIEASTVLALSIRRYVTIV